MRSSIKKSQIWCLIYSVSTPGYSAQRAFNDKITEDDLIIEMPDISSFFSEETARDEVFDISRRNEKKYDLLYYRDVLQQERSLVPLVMPYSHGYSIKQIEHLTDQQICNAINHFFLFCESIFEQHSIKFCLVWPRTAIETVLTLIAEHFEIPVTYPYVSKGEGNLIYWANGPFADGKYHISLYRSDKNLSSQASSTITEPTDRNV